MTGKLKYSILSVAILMNVATYSQNSTTDYVNPFIGVDGGGNVLPGACLPFSLVRINPVTALPQPTNGYQTGKPVIGFVQTNVSGTGGGGRYGNFMVTPQVAVVEPDNLGSMISDEVSQVGYYAARLVKNNVFAELTCTDKVGIQRFSFPDQQTAQILITASSVIDRGINRPNDGKCLNSFIEILGDNTIVGYAELQGGWGHMQPYKLYFCAEFDRRYDSHGVWVGSTKEDNASSAKGAKCGAYFSFNADRGRKITLKVAVSTLSIDKARENLRKTDGIGFDAARAKAVDTWAQYLDKIKIKGGTADQRTLFYTGLYRSYIMPTDITGENPQWVSDEPCYWDFYCIWDTFRCNSPLYTILTPDIQVDIIKSLLDVYKHKGWLPEAWVTGGFCKQQGGTDTDNVIADAIVKGLKGFDYDLAYEAMLKNAECPADEQNLYEGLLVTGKHKDYIENGYVPKDKQCCVSYTLENAYNDFCLAQVAKAMGKKDDAAKYLKRSLNCYNLFDASTGFFWAKDKEGKWAEDFSPTHHGNPWWRGPYFYEGTPWHYSTYVPHDFNGLISRHGGKEMFTKFLDRFFDGKFFTHENEPDIHSPYLYNYVGQPHKTVEKLYSIINEQYRNTRNGLPGNDDSGTMSSWYVFSTMGFYPIAGQNFYLLGAPTFDEVEIALPNDKKFVVTSTNLSSQNRYVQGVRLNGRKYDKSWILHSDIVKGGKLTFEMGDKPSSWAVNSTMPQGASQIINNN